MLYFGEKYGGDASTLRKTCLPLEAHARRHAACSQQRLLQRNRLALVARKLCALELINARFRRDVRSGHYCILRNFRP